MCVDVFEQGAQKRESIGRIVVGSALECDRGGGVGGVYLVTVLGRRSDSRCCYGRCEAASSKKPPRMAGVTK